MFLHAEDFLTFLTFFNILYSRFPPCRLFDDELRYEGDHFLNPVWKYEQLFEEDATQRLTMACLI